jgi:hypothetical protein
MYSDCADALACRTDAPRIWVIRIYNRANDPLAGFTTPVATVLHDQYRPVTTYEPPGNGATVVLFVRS